MNAIITASSLHGFIQAPASKSSMQRACAAAWIRKGETVLYNYGYSNDDLAALDIIKRMGARVESLPDAIKICSELQLIPREIHCGESGLSVRMFTPLAALADKEITITGSGSLLKRPMHFFDEVFPKLGVAVHSKGGFLPMRIKGPLVPANIEVDGSISSQFLTGLIMAFVAAGAEDKTITVRNLKSKPYINLTLSVLREFGLQAPENRDYKEFYFPAKEKKQTQTVVEYHVEADWSSGAFLLVAGALAGPIMVTGLDLLSTQADRAIVDILMSANAGIAMEAKGIRIHPGEMDAFETDATDFPDLFPPLVVLASACKGKSKIKGVSRLLHKESDRANTLREEFGRLGVTIGLDDDYMVITGTDTIHGNVVSSHDDHRIAMALAIRAMKASGITTIVQSEAVNKSYPQFFKDLKKLGAHVTLQS